MPFPPSIDTVDENVHFKFDNLPALEILRFHLWNPAVHAIENFPATLPLLRVLKVTWDSEVQAEVLNKLHNFKKLEDLFLEGPGISPKHIARLESPQLERIHISTEKEAKGFDFKLFSRFQHLKYLHTNFSTPISANCVLPLWELEAPLKITDLVLLSKKYVNPFLLTLFKCDPTDVFVCCSFWC